MDEFLTSFLIYRFLLEQREHFVVPVSVYPAPRPVLSPCSQGRDPGWAGPAEPAGAAAGRGLRRPGGHGDRGSSGSAGPLGHPPPTHVAAIRCTVSRSLQPGFAWSGAVRPAGCRGGRNVEERRPRLWGSRRRAVLLASGRARAMVGWGTGSPSSAVDQEGLSPRLGGRPPPASVSWGGVPGLQGDRVPMPACHVVFLLEIHW